MPSEILDEYLKLFPAETDRLAGLLQLLHTAADPTDRHNYDGHITGAGVVLSPDRSQILLIHHRLLHKWLQPGGHWEPEDKTPLDVARREVMEETGQQQLQLIPLKDTQPLIPFDIDSHFIAKPKSPQLPHWHHDFRYLFMATDLELHHEVAEVFAAQWFEIDAPETADVRRLIEKLRASNLLK